MPLVPPSPPSPLSRRTQHQAFVRFSSRLALVFALVAFVDAAFAQAMVGQSLLTFAGNYIVAPLGIFAVVISLAAAFFRPEMAKGGVLAAILCAVIFFVIRMAPQLTTALKN